jgi:nucleotide-binding universal stress UspA family protein
MAKIQPKVKIDLFPTEPITFWAPVAIPTSDGRELEISFLFRHRTRKEQAKLAEERIDRARERFNAAQAAEAAEKARMEAERKAAATLAKATGEDVQVLFPSTPKLVEQVLDEMAESVEGICEIAEDWNVDGHPFAVEALTQLCDLHGAAANAISMAYRDALSKGRLGN